VDGKKDELEINEDGVAILQHVALLQIWLSFFANSMRTGGFYRSTVDGGQC
jgi:hypothetical protein